jgi:type III secretion protein S
MILMLSGPPLIAAIASGVLISLIQTLVQVQDQTLPFSVKLVCVAAVLSMTGGWIGSELIGLTNTVFVTIQRGGF